MVIESYFFIITGIFVGLVATLFMTLFEIPFWKKWGLKGVLEWHENQILFSKLTNDKGERLNLFGIFLLHFINGALGGLAFYLILVLFPILVSSIYLVGVIYGLVLWFLTLLPIHKPITGIDPFNHPQGVGPLVASLVGHLIFGITLSSVFGILSF
ncbi:MAG TPA: hypothetical protein VFT71_05710 [Candidatus Nitrosocosmicus sp.]|nr:hypothetical protein [Candidatus Nitrosocosmicus sp.]